MRWPWKQKEPELPDSEMRAVDEFSLRIAQHLLRVTLEEDTPEDRANNEPILRRQIKELEARLLEEK